MSGPSILDRLVLSNILMLYDAHRQRLRCGNKDQMLCHSLDAESEKFKLTNMVGYTGQACDRSIRNGRL